MSNNRLSEFKDKDYYREILSYWRNQDVLITRRAALFITSNTILFFVFHSQNIQPQLLVAAVGFAILLNVIWLVMGFRTSSTYDLMVREISKLEGFTLDNKSNKPKEQPASAERLVFWNILRRQGRSMSSTQALCKYVPCVFILAWIVFSLISYFSPQSSSHASPKHNTSVRQSGVACFTFFGHE